MSRHKSRVVRFLLYALACVLICAAFASELPEQLTLKNDTSNDYSLRPSTSLKRIQTLNSHKQDSSFLVTTAPQHTSWSLLSVPGRASFQVESLFILNMRIAEPATAPRTTNRRRMMAWLIARRHGLTKVLQICAFWAFAFHIPFPAGPNAHVQNNKSINL